MARRPTTSREIAPPLAAWLALRSDATLQLAAAAVDPGDVGAVARLRARWPQAEVAAALSLAEARRRLARKFERAAELWADREAAEQATSERVAAWKAMRFARAGASAVEDRCCGLGGDAMALTRVATTVAIDRSEVRAWMTSVNAGCAVRVDDAGEAPLVAPFVHVDPARRDEASGRRTFDLAGLSPSIECCCSLASSAQGGAIKLGPGMPLPLRGDLPGADRAEIELISDDGALVQAVCWFGSLAAAPGLRTATMLPRGVSRSGSPVPTPLAAHGRFGRFLYVPDPAIERSGLLGDLARELGLGERSPGLGILTSDERVESAWLVAYEALARPRARERDVRDALRGLGAGGARVRTRGRSADADAWTRALRGDGDVELDVFLLRCGDSLEAIVARPIEPA